MTIKVTMTVGDVSAGRKVIVTAVEGGTETQIATRLVTGDSFEAWVHGGRFLRVEEALDDQPATPVQEPEPEAPVEEPQAPEAPAQPEQDAGDPPSATEA